MLAEKLGWRSVDDLRRGMSGAEWLAWWIYYSRKAQRMELEKLKAGG